MGIPDHSSPLTPSMDSFPQGSMAGSMGKTSSVALSKDWNFDATTGVATRTAELNGKKYSFALNVDDNASLNEWSKKIDQLIISNTPSVLGELTQALQSGETLSIPLNEAEVVPPRPELKELATKVQKFLLTPGLPFTSSGNALSITPSVTSRSSFRAPKPSNPVPTPIFHNLNRRRNDSSIDKPNKFSRRENAYAVPVSGQRRDSEMENALLASEFYQQNERWIDENIHKVSEYLGNPDGDPAIKAAIRERLDEAADSLDPETRQTYMKNAVGIALLAEIELRDAQATSNNLVQPSVNSNVSPENDLGIRPNEPSLNPMQNRMNMVNKLIANYPEAWAKIQVYLLKSRNAEEGTVTDLHKSIQKGLNDERGFIINHLDTWVPGTIRSIIEEELATSQSQNDSSVDRPTWDSTMQRAPTPENIQEEKGNRDRDI